MKNRLSMAFGAVLALLMCSWTPTSAQVSAGISITDEGIKSFYLAIGEHYRVPEQQVVVVREKRIPDEELPVVFFLATRANVGPDVIVALRLGGKSWLEIVRHYKLSPEIFYVEVTQVSGPPYGRAYGYFKKHPRSKWREMELSDVDVVNLVNLKFMVDHYKYTPEQVIRWRSDGKKFVTINQEIRKAKQAKPAKQAKRAAVAETDHNGSGDSDHPRDHNSGKGKKQK